MRAEIRANLQGIKHDRTRKQYLRDGEHFIRFCREEFNVSSLSECKQYLQIYCDVLVLRGYTSSTIHTYLAGACKALGSGDRLSTIKKPLRKTSEYSRGRTTSQKSSTFSTKDDERFKTLLEFQQKVGLRRAELAHLRGDDLVYDESNYLCVRVRSGKGGKYQLQRLHPKDYKFVQSVFNNKGSHELLFSSETMNNKLNLHAVRAQRARDAYADYVYRIKTKPEYSKILEAEILARWNKYNINQHTGLAKQFHFEELRGNYILREANRKFALEHNLPISYNKLAVMATIIFVLSHRRNDVTVTSYLLAI